MKNLLKQLCQATLSNSKLQILWPVLMLAACQPELPQTVRSGLVYCSEGSPESFNPQLVTSGTTIDAISQQLYDRLLDIDANSGELKPALASSWRVRPCANAATSKAASAALRSRA